MAMDRIPSKVIVSVRDLESLKLNAIKFLKKNKMLKRNETIKHTWGCGLVVDKNGKHYVIDTEGVGSESPLEEQGYKVEWWKETINKKGELKSFDMFPCCSQKVSLEELLKNSTEKESVPLDQFIRTFGSRLDQNYRVWENFLTGAK
jgi:hypothetical protein